MRHDTRRSVDATAADRPMNRAERRAAARGRDIDSAQGPATPRTSGPEVQVKPAHVRTDYAARRTG